MKSMFGDTTAKVGREDIFKPPVRNKNLHQHDNGNEVRVINFAVSKF
jgi:hypothetical protein